MDKRSNDGERYGRAYGTKAFRIRIINKTKDRRQIIVSVCGRYFYKVLTNIKFIDDDNKTKTM